MFRKRNIYSFLDFILLSQLNQNTNINHKKTLSKRGDEKSYMWHLERHFEDETLFSPFLNKYKILHFLDAIARSSVLFQSHLFHICWEWSWWLFVEGMSIQCLGLDCRNENISVGFFFIDLHMLHNSMLITCL